MRRLLPTLVMAATSRSCPSPGRGRREVWRRPGRDQLRGEGPKVVLRGDGGDDDLSAKARHDAARRGGRRRDHGSRHGDKIGAGAGNHTLDAGAGDDHQVSAAPGDDHVHGGSGTDFLHGDDGYDGYDGYDTIWTDGGEGGNCSITGSGNFDDGDLSLVLRLDEPTEEYGFEWSGLTDTVATIACDTYTSPYPIHSEVADQVLGRTWDTTDPMHMLTGSTATDSGDSYSWTLTPLALTRKGG